MAWRDIKGWPVTRPHLHWGALCPPSGLQTWGWKPAPHSCARAGRAEPTLEQLVVCTGLLPAPARGPACPPPLPPFDQPPQACTGFWQLPLHGPYLTPCHPSALSSLAPSPSESLTRPPGALLAQLAEATGHWPVSRRATLGTGPGVVLV